MNGDKIGLYRRRFLFRIKDFCEASATYFSNPEFVQVFGAMTPISQCETFATAHLYHFRMQIGQDKKPICFMQRSVGCRY